MHNFSCRVVFSRPKFFLYFLQGFSHEEKDFVKPERKKKELLLVNNEEGDPHLFIFNIIFLK
jgi:hypothetical protein